MPLPLRIMYAEVNIVPVMVARLGRSRRRQPKKNIKFEHGNMFIAEVRSISWNIVCDCVISFYFLFSGHKTYINLSLTGKCQGPTKCGRNHFCVGFEGKKVFCYGSDTRCLWYSNTCNNDADCNKYTINSPKFTNGDNVDCSKLTGWRIDACTCIGKLDLQRVKALDNPFYFYKLFIWSVCLMGSQ